MTDLASAVSSPKTNAVRTCQSCKWVVNFGADYADDYRCGHPDANQVRVSPVTGRLVTLLCDPDAGDERETGRCGPSGLNYEPRLRAKLWRRIFGD